MVPPSSAQRERVRSMTPGYRRRHWLLVQVAVWVVGTPILLLRLFGYLSLGVTVGLLLVALVLLRAPLLKSSSSMTLQTAANADAVEETFAGPYSPAAWQFWGVADDSDLTETGGRTEQSTYFGLGSDTLCWDATRKDDEIRLEFGLNGTTQKVTTVTVEGSGDGESVVHLDSKSGRSGLRNVPSTLFGRSTEPVWNELGFEVVRHDREPF